MPYALESFDLRGYDLIVSSESGPAKGILAPSTAHHVCYCHSPMRYLWDLYPDYLHDWSSPLQKLPLALFSHHLRLWDFATASRVDTFLANSQNVARRIRRVYNRESTVVYPPVAVETFRHEPDEDYLFMAGEMVAYKRMDLAVEACTRLGRRLKIAGSGPEYRKLRKRAGPTIEFCGRVTDDELRTLYARSQAFLMPGEEDFGIAPVESLASGKPVIAWARGGALETVAPDCGLLYDDPFALDAAVRCFETRTFDPRRLRDSALRFSASAFDAAMRPMLRLSR